MTTMMNFLGLSLYGNRINSSYLVASAWFFMEAVRLWELGVLFRLRARLAFPGGAGLLGYHPDSLPLPTLSPAPPLGEEWMPEEMDASNDHPAVHSGLLLTLSQTQFPHFSNVQVGQREF